MQIVLFKSFELNSPQIYISIIVPLVATAIRLLIRLLYSQELHGQDPYSGPLLILHAIESIAMSSIDSTVLSTHHLSAN